MKTVDKLNFLSKLKAGGEIHFDFYVFGLTVCIFIPFFQENPQSNKKDELDNLDTSCGQGQDSPSEQNKGASLDSSQCSPSPASREDSEISEDSDQEVDIEGDKGYFNAG